MSKSHTLFLCVGIIVQMTAPKSVETTTEAILVNGHGGTIHVPITSENETAFEIGKSYEADFSLCADEPAQSSDSSPTTEDAASNSTSSDDEKSSEVAEDSQSEKAEEKQAA